MPNSRRRKFSVQNDAERKIPAKGNASTTNSLSSSKSQAKTNNTTVKTIIKNCPNRTAVTEPMEIVLECDNCSSAALVKKTEEDPADLNINKLNSHKRSTHTVLVRMPQPAPLLTICASKRSMGRTRREPPHQQRARVRSPKKIDNSLDSMTSKLFQRSLDSASSESSQHSFQALSSKQRITDKPLRVQPNYRRARVRSPKKNLRVLKTPSIEIQKVVVEDIGTCVDVGIDSSMETVGTNVIDWAQETQEWAQEIQVFSMNAAELEVLELEQQSDHSLDDMCRICHSGECLSSDTDRLVSACNCRGTVGRVHVRCLERWLTESGKSRCELCGTRYHTRRVHRYGVLKALVMWFLSQNAKQLMVDSLGIMLMSPLAVLAAWLSGRTLAGLMTQESQVTPWPLASTFVLACMTLVCYYCWIVSAATRHALGWWIWYRSQYEVRLELQPEE